MCICPPSKACLSRGRHVSNGGILMLGSSYSVAAHCLELQLYNSPYSTLIVERCYFQFTARMSVLCIFSTWLFVLCVISSDVSPWPWPWSLRPKSKSLALGLKSSALAVVLGLGRRLEKILTHYIDTINSLSFDSDAKLADICSQMEFVPLGYLFERFLLFLPVQPLLRGSF